MASTNPLKKLLTGSKEGTTRWQSSPRLICRSISCFTAVYCCKGMQGQGRRQPLATSPLHRNTQEQPQPRCPGTCPQPQLCPQDRAPDRPGSRLRGWKDTWQSRFGAGAVYSFPVPRSLGSTPCKALGAEGGRLTARALKLLTTSPGALKLHRYCDKGLPEVQEDDKREKPVFLGKDPLSMSKGRSRESRPKRKA